MVREPNDRDESDVVLVLHSSGGVTGSGLCVNGIRTLRVVQ